MLLALGTSDFTECENVCSGGFEQAWSAEDMSTFCPVDTKKLQRRIDGEK